MKFAFALRSSSDLPVHNGLCYTPSEMLEKASRGIPIASQQLPDEHFTQGDNNHEPVVDIQYRRGIDINDLWLEQQRTYSKFKNAYDKAVNLKRSLDEIN